MGLAVDLEVEHVVFRIGGGVPQTDRRLRHILHHQIEIRPDARLRLVGVRADDDRRPQPAYGIAPLEFLLGAGPELHTDFRPRRAGLLIRRVDPRDRRDDTDANRGRKHGDRSREGTRNESRMVGSPGKNRRFIGSPSVLR